MKYYGSSKEDVLKELSTSSMSGLSNDDVCKRREKYGLNEFSVKEEGGLLKDIIDALKEPMIIVLILAAFISAAIGEYSDSIGIVCAILLGIGIGIVTEGKSKKAAEELSKLTENIDVKVLRDGKVKQIPKNELVPGDIVYIETGDMIPADGRLINSINLKVREDMLTGESEDVTKKHDVIIGMEQVQSKSGIIEQEPIPAKQINMIFTGTLVAYGRGTMVVTAIGDKTEMGKIAQDISNVSEEQTPLQIKLGGLGSFISKISGALAGLLFIFMMIKMIVGGVLKIDTSGIMPFLASIEPVKTAFTVCIALIVAAVPEGLPTLVNMTLAVTMNKMAKINALVTKKEACETIGSVSVICSDKTGTLTQNRMTVETVYVDGKYIEDSAYKSNSYFLENCLLNSTADIEKDGDKFKYLGSATECALLLYNLENDYRKARKEAEILVQKPFNSQLKRMTTVIKNNEDIIALLKGAPEVILEKCSYVQKGNSIVQLTDEIKNEILEEIQKLQEKSMRVLGFSYCIMEEAMLEACAEAEGEITGGEFVFSGFVGIRDPLRPDVKESVETAKKAGVSVKMLTGDNINTARAIGLELGLLDGGKKAVESSYIDTLTDEELREEIKNIGIVARSKPDTKMRIVNALQRNEEVVAVTGDGINDAPALSKADVGIAMGISGTEVSKSAADIILTDDSFSTIVRGIEWGRGIYENFQRFIQFQLTVNIVAFLIAIISQIIGQDMPFTTIQLLWVNIIMDGPPALALGLEPVRRHVLDKKPINRKANIISNTMKVSIMMNSLYMIVILLVQQNFNILGVAEAEKETVMFSLFAFMALFNAFNCREFGLDSILPNLTKNTIFLKIIAGTAVSQVICTMLLKTFFNTVLLSFSVWIKVVALSASIIVVNEIVKFIGRKARK